MAKRRGCKQGVQGRAATQAADNDQEPLAAPAAGADRARRDSKTGTNKCSLLARLMRSL